jgi:hypothetical protein
MNGIVACFLKLDLQSADPLFMRHSYIPARIVRFEYLFCFTPRAEKIGLLGLTKIELARIPFQKASLLLFAK